MADANRDAEQGGSRRRRRALVQLLLAAPFVGTLWVPFYNHADPALAGIPFFYWYQLGWVLIGAAINAVVYLAMR